jgi:archaeal flagellar protein FlaJ
MPKKSKAILKKIKKEDYHFLKDISIQLFGGYADKYAEYFKDLKVSIMRADIGILFRTYISMMFFLTFFVFVLTFLVTLAFVLYSGIGIVPAIAGVLILPTSFSVIAFLLYYLYPITLSQKRKDDIDSNLPFAINHMSAIAGSGVPPRVMFKVLSKFKEYGEIARESKKIYRNIEVFGMDDMTSIKDVASKTPSVDFKDLLQGIMATIQTGGNLKSYLKEESDKTLFDFRIRRSKYIQQLSVYSDFYTALLIAAPLIFVVMMPVLSMMQGTMFGMTTQEMMNLGLIVLVALNVAFLAFLQTTQQKM